MTRFYVGVDSGGFPKYSAPLSIDTIILNAQADEEYTLSLPVGSNVCLVTVPNVLISKSGITIPDPGDYNDVNYCRINPALFPLYDINEDGSITRWENMIVKSLVDQ